jgi:hypothetical protein
MYTNAVFRPLQYIDWRNKMAACNEFERAKLQPHASLASLLVVITTQKKAPNPPKTAQGTPNMYAAVFYCIKQLA